MKEIPKAIEMAVDSLLLPYDTSLQQLLTAVRTLENGDRPTRFISVREVADQLSLTKSTVFRLMRQGALKGKKIGKGATGGRCLISMDSVAHYIASLPDWTPLKDR